MTSKAPPNPRDQHSYAGDKPQPNADHRVEKRNSGDSLKEQSRQGGAQPRPQDG
jgi:hypothetical protein